MENVLNTVKNKVKTTKVLAILGVVLILLGLFFNVGKIGYKVKNREKYKASITMYYEPSDEQLRESIKQVEKTEFTNTSMKYWGGPVMLILSAVALALVYINFIESKIPEETRKKIAFWDKLKNKKMVLVIAAIIMVILISTWQIPVNKDIYEDIESSEIKEMKEESNADGVKMSHSIGAGFILIFLGAASLGAYPFLYKPEESDVVAEPVANNE